ncbi:MAG: glycerophosphodiester phosphodiesterase [Gemmatimonadetes bacterium]|nr:glycerophosphodiester phosphodiesterase [Gemmatimonadota bacterium]
MIRPPLPGLVALIIVLGLAAMGTAAVDGGMAMIIIGHRGAAGHAPEHTFASWDAALEMGADYLEQDLQMTADGYLVVMHDDTLDRTARGAGCTGHVIRKTLDELAACDAGTWFNDSFPDRARPEYAALRIPTLDSVFSRYAGRARFYIETKNPDDAPGMEQALVALLAKHGLAPRSPGDPRVIIQSFSTESLRRVRALATALPLVQLFRSRESSRTIRNQLDDLIGLAWGVGPHWEDVDAALVAAAHRRGFVIHPYTVNEPAHMRALIELGVDGMFTDYPDRLATVLGR